MREHDKKEQQVYDDGTNTFFWYNCHLPVLYSKPSNSVIVHAIVYLSTHVFCCRQAHTISAGVLICLGLIYVALFDQPTNDTMFNLQRGVVAVVVVFILIGMVHMPDGPFVRPHPALWRLVLCVLILYILLLVFLLFQVCCYVIIAAVHLLPRYNYITSHNASSFHMWYLECLREVYQINGVWSCLLLAKHASTTHFLFDNDFSFNFYKSL